MWKLAIRPDLRHGLHETPERIGDAPRRPACGIRTAGYAAGYPKLTSLQYQ